MFRIPDMMIHLGHFPIVPEVYRPLYYRRAHRFALNTRTITTGILLSDWSDVELILSFDQQMDDREALTLHLWEFRESFTRGRFK